MVSTYRRFDCTFELLFCDRMPIRHNDNALCAWNEKQAIRVSDKLLSVWLMCAMSDDLVSTNLNLKGEVITTLLLFSPDRYSLYQWRMAREQMALPSDAAEG